MCCGSNGEPDKRERWYHEFYSGPFEIQKMFNGKEVSGKVSGAYFLFSGVVSGSVSSTSVCQFSWKTKSGYYILSSIPFNAIKIDPDENVEVPQLFITPKIYREWRGINSPIDINNNIDWVTIKCHPDQWKVDITLPMDE